jgi:O-antigen/teichoic acid export membrane protein
MTRNADLRLIGVDAAATGETLKGGFAPATGPARIKAIFAGDGRGRPLARASIAALAVFVVGAGLSYAAQLVTARVIGPDSYGVYAYVLAWVTLLGYFSTLGFHVSVLRFVPAYQAKEEWALVRGVIQYSQRGAAGTAISIALIGVCGLVAFRGSLRPELAVTFLLGLAAVPFLALHLIGASLVRAFGGIIAALAPERIVRDGVLLAIVAAVFWDKSYRLDATLAMGATLVSSVVMFGLVRIFLRRLRPPALNHAKPAYAAENWWRPTLPLTVIMAADSLMSRSGVIALGLTGNTRDAGIFAVAFGMAILTAMPRMAVATVFAPTVSALFAREDQAGLQSLSAKAACLSLLGTACCAVPLLLLAQPLLAWFGRDFVAGAPIVKILVLGQVLAAACGPQQHLITMTGHERAGAAMLAICAGSSFIACMLMIDWLGTTGVALVMTLALIAWNVAMGVFIHRRLHLMPGLLASFKAMQRRKRVADCGF